MKVSRIEKQWRPSLLIKMYVEYDGNRKLILIRMVCIKENIYPPPFAFFGSDFCSCVATLVRVATVA